MEGKIIKNEVDPTGLLEIIARREMRSGKQEIERSSYDGAVQPGLCSMALQTSVRTRGSVLSDSALAGFRTRGTIAAPSWQRCEHDVHMMS